MHRRSNQSYLCITSTHDLLSVDSSVPIMGFIHQFIICPSLIGEFTNAHLRMTFINTQICVRTTRFQPFHSFILLHCAKFRHRLINAIKAFRQNQWMSFFEKVYYNKKGQYQFKSDLQHTIIMFLEVTNCGSCSVVCLLSIVYRQYQICDILDYIILWIYIQIVIRSSPDCIQGSNFIVIV